METRRFIFLLALLLLFGVGAWADTVPIDPQIIIVGRGDPTPIFGLTFPVPFGSCAGTGLESEFCFEGINFSGVDWTNLALMITPPDPSTAIGALSCSSDLFALNNCSGMVGGPGETLFVLFLQGTGPGIPTEPIDFDPPFAIGFSLFPTGTTVSAAANVPEPGTMALFLTGVGALVARRRLRNGRSAGA